MLILYKALTLATHTCRTYLSQLTSLVLPDCELLFLLWHYPSHFPLPLFHLIYHCSPHHQRGPSFLCLLSEVTNKLSPTVSHLSREEAEPDLYCGGYLE